MSLIPGATVPSDTTPNVGTIIEAVVAVLTWTVGVYAAGRKMGFSKALREIREGVLRARYERLYAPMVALFTTRHVAEFSAVLYPYLGVRWRRAVGLGKEGHIREAARAVFDRGKTGPTAEIEYGGSFPLETIKSMLQGNEAIADPELLNKIRWADQAQLELEDDPGGHEPTRGEMTSEDFELFLHVQRGYDRLAKRFSPKTP